MISLIWLRLHSIDSSEISSLVAFVLEALEHGLNKKVEGICSNINKMVSCFHRSLQHRNLDTTSEFTPGPEEKKGEFVGTK